jgi:hypothetical protein
VFNEFSSKPALGYAFPGPGGKASLANSIVQTAISAVGKLASETHAVRRDAGLSPSSRAAKVHAQREAAKAVIERAQTLHLSQEKQRIDNTRTKLFALPTLDPGDAVSAAIYREIRERWPLRTDSQRAELMNAISKGDKSSDRILYALAMDPYLTPESRWAQAIHADRVAAANPQAVAALETDGADLEWAQGVVVRLHNILRDTESRAIPALTPETA